MLKQDPRATSVRSSDGLDEREIICGVYRHYKGNDYQVLGTAYHSESEGLLVLYRPLYGSGALWVRPFDNFNEELKISGKYIRRFELVDEVKA